MNSKNNIIIIAGLSGVGKTYFINQLLNKNTYKHFSAGNLIKKRLANIAHDKLRELDKSNILANQYLLVEQFNEELKTMDSNLTVLFDAHMIIDSGQGIIDIPYEIFKDLQPTKLLFLYDEPYRIIERRKNDGSRERPKLSIKELESQQNYSIKLAEEYAAKLTIPFIKVKVGSILEL